MATLGELVTRWRKILDDDTEPYLWSNDELTNNVNFVINQLCFEIGLIEDSTTSSICEVTVTTPTAIYSVSDRITYISRAKLDSQTQPIPIRTVPWMDVNISDWENADADEPQYLLTEGIGTNKVRIYPPPDANDTLYLTVWRLPLADLDYTTDVNNSPEIHTKYHQYLDNGVYWQAYGKQDADTYDPEKAVYHLGLFDDDKESIKRADIKYRYRDEIVSPAKGFL